MALRPFHFRLERVLDMRERAEDEAKEALAAALAEREQWARRLAGAAKQLQSARDAQKGASASGVSIGEMLAHQAFVERAERELRAAELDLSRRDAEVDARRVALQEAAREKQVLVKLRDKQAHAHRREAERLEAQHVDELALAMHRRRTAVA